MGKNSKQIKKDNGGHAKTMGLANRIVLYVVLFMMFIATFMLTYSYTVSFKHFSSAFDQEADSAMLILNGKVETFTTDVTSYSGEIVRMVDANPEMKQRLIAGDYSVVEKIAHGAGLHDQVYFIGYYVNGQKVWEHKGVPDGLDINKLSDDVTGFSANGTSIGVASKHALANGYVVMGFDFANSELLDKAVEGSNSHASIYKGNQVVATTFIDETGARAIGTQMSEEAKKGVFTDNVEYQVEEEMFGIRVSSNYKPFKDGSGNTIGAIYSGANIHDSYNEIVSSIYINIAIAVFVVTGASLYMFYIVRKYVTKPLAEVANASNNLIEGKLSEDDVEIYRYDEVGKLTDVVNKTAAEFRSYIDDIHEVLSNIENGNLTYRSSLEYEGDFVRIKNSLNEIAEKLTEVFTSVNNASEQVNLNSSQISTASQMLAEGTSTQAATIQEISSTVVDLSDRVNDNAQNTAKAKKLSDQTNDRVHDQNAKMSNMLIAMNDIKEKSNEIQKIIKSIDDIAFQTNILSLNAAVEAARAGAAGKGFAVVAEEVRNLAIKSAEAAAETTQYIEASINAVNDGVVLAQEAAASLTEVMTISSETNDIIVDISQKTEEQATALKEVSIGLDQISDVVQQNSATAEENAASCAELDDQVRHLQNILSQFTL